MCCAVAPPEEEASEHVECPGARVRAQQARQQPRKAVVSSQVAGASKPPWGARRHGFLRPSSSIHTESIYARASLVHRRQMAGCNQ